MAKIPPGILAWITLVLVESTVAGAMPEYAAAEWKKHIGETARVTGKVDCVDAHRRSHILSLGGCEPKIDFYVRVPYGVPGPDLNVTEFKGVVITVSGKIEKSEVDDLPFIDVTSTSQIVPHKLQKAKAEASQKQRVADPSQTNAPAEAPAGQTSPHGSYTRPADAKELPAGTNILGSPAEPGIADVTALVEFTGNGATNKGSWPNGLIFATDGDIYGTTEQGGANDYGTVFKMTPAGALSTIVEFAGDAAVNSSGFPMAPLIERRDGDFSGTTSGGGVGPTGKNNLDNGTIFKLSRSGVLTTLVRFSCNGATNKGCTPYSGLVEAPNGDFYGTTFSGGSGKPVPIPGFRGFGTIYKMSPAGQLTTLYDFSGHVTKGQGGAPWAGLTLAKDRNFYGNTWLGGGGHAGTIFKMTPQGAMTTLVNFSGFKPPKKGGGSVAGLVQAGDGNFYGTCPIGGGGNAGTVFKMTPGGAFTNLVEFSNNDPKGAQPHAPLAEGNDGNLYGTTAVGGAYNYGTIFRVTPNGSFKVLWNFNNPNKIHECAHPGTGPFLKDKEGNFYGTTKWGGRSDWGTVFKLTLHNSDMQASTAPPANSPSRATSQPVQMEQARAEAKTGAKKIVVTQPSAQAAQNEQPSNKSEVTPESIAEAFIQAYSGSDLDALASLYADRVDHTNSGVISNATVRAQAKEYFARWPVRQWSLAGPVKTISLGGTRQKVIFSATYDASDPQTNKHASGIAQETLILASDKSGAIKIVSQKEQTSKRGSSQPGEKTSGDLRLSAAKAEYEHSSHDEAARIRYVTKLADIYKAELGSALAAVDLGHELRKHPMPRNVDSRKLSQLLIGEWDSPRHTYVFRADGTYGVSDEQRDKWRIDGNEYIDDVSRGPIILLDRNYFIYALGQGAVVYIRANDSEAERYQSADTNTQNTAAEVNSTSNGSGDKPSDSSIKQKVLGYWSSGRHVYLVKPNGVKYMLSGTTAIRWDVRNGVYYEDGEPQDIITLTQKEFSYRSRRDRITWDLERVSYEKGEEIRRMFPEEPVPPPDPQRGVSDGKRDTNQRRTGTATSAIELTAADAARHIGQNAAVTGVVTSVEQSRAHLHMGLGGTPDKPDMYVLVPSYGETDIFPGYFKYRGATITVLGRIQRNSGYPGIDVTDPAQIVAKTEGLTDHAYLARMKQKRGDLDGAIAEYNVAIEQDKQNSENYDKRASIKAEKGDAEGAIADYTRAIELGPNDTNAYSARAHLKLLTGDFNAALADYDKIVQIFPRWADAYNQRADIKKTKGDIAGANADYQMALQLDPANQTFRKNLQQAQASTSGKRAVPVANITPAFAQASPAATAAQSKPKSAEIIDVAPGYAEQGIKAGNIRVIFSDGHVAVQTYAGNCMEPHVSASGLVGWIRCKGFDRKNYALGEKIVVGPPNGLTKQFSPDPKVPFIVRWAFADNDSAIVIQSMSFHGPSSYARYDLATGKVTNKKDGRDDSEPAPDWAQPLSN